MKQTFFIGVLALVLVKTISTGIPNFTLPKIEGGTQSTAVYAGKKILIVTLPVVQSASADSMLYQLDTLASAHSTALRIIAVPPIEDGFTEANKAQLLQWYRSKLGNTVLITDGLRTRKASGSQQHPLFKWLTNVTQNEVFDIDADGPWYKYVIDEAGVFYAVLAPQTKISGQRMQRTLGY